MNNELIALGLQAAAVIGTFSIALAAWSSAKAAARAAATSNSAADNARATVEALNKMAVANQITAEATNETVEVMKETAKETAKTVEATRIASEAKLLIDFFDAYSEPEMALHLRTLRQFGETDGFRAEFGKLVESQIDRLHVVDEARRHVSHFFGKARRLHRLGFLSDAAAEEILSLSGTAVLMDVAEPLGEELNPEHDRSLQIWVEARWQRPDSRIREIPPNLRRRV